MTTATFYSEESANRRKSFLLALFVVAFLAVFGHVIGYVVGLGTGNEVAYGIGALAIAIAFGLLSVAGSYFGGDKLVLASSHAQEIGPQQSPALFNVVAEMATAAGVPMPKVYIIDDPSPNAFATGRDPQHSSVAITSGLLQKLNREELQGVIGHEMSHVRNYDIRFTLIVGVLVGSIALLAQLFLRYTFWFGGGRRRSSSGGDGQVQLVLMLVGVVLALLSPLIAMLLQLAISRKRELLADADGALLTRNPNGLADALQKITSDPHSMRHANKATAHLFIASPLHDTTGKPKGFMAGLFDTHPDPAVRIAKLREMAL